MAKEIDVIADTERLTKYWAQRNSQIERDRDLLNLTKPLKREGQMNWVSNEPKVLYNTSRALMSSYPPRFRLPLSINFEEEEKQKISKAERLCVGIHRSLDARQMQRGGTYWLYELAYWILSGWYAVFAPVMKKDDDVLFVADMFDPLTVYPEWDSDGLLRCARSFETERETLQMMISQWEQQGYDVKNLNEPATKQVKIINYWVRMKDKVYNTVWFHDKNRPKTAQEAKTVTEFKGLNHIPIHIGAIGNPERSSSGWQERYGESILAINRDMYEYFNYVLRLLAIVMAETTYPNLVSKTRTGNPAVNPEDVRGYGQVLPLKIEESVEVLKHATTPEETMQILTILAKQTQKGGLPDVVYGGVPVELSGFAISQLMAAIKYRVGPYMNTMQALLGNIMSDFLYQYKKNKMPKVKLSTTNPNEIRKGLFFIEEFSYKDVPEVMFIEATIPITSALDKTQQILFARQALEEPRLLSRETIWDEVLEIQDAEQEYNRIMQDKMLDDPFVQGLELIEEMWRREGLYRSQGDWVKADAFRRYIMQKELALGLRQGIPSTPGQGIGPEGMPPEFGAQGSSPDSVRAAMGVGPPGLRRRPQTPDERAASQAGRLISPSGQTLIP